MDPQTLPNNKSKKIVRILLVITGILGLALIAIAIYFYAIGDSSKQTNSSEATCGCYYIDPAVISECGDPKRAFKFNILTTTTDKTCSAQCSTNEISPNLLNSTTEQDLYQICRLNSIQDARCNEMTIKDQDGKIVTGKITNNNKITVEAKFDNVYTEQKFIINNQNTDPDVVSTDKKTISKTISDLSNKTTLEIVATATDKNGDTINSTICRRLIEVQQSGVESVNSLVLETTKDSNNIVKISNIDISVGNLTTEDDLSLIFTFTNSIPSLTMTKGFTVNTTKGEITAIQSDLYNKSNFAQSSSFENLDEVIGEIEATVDVRKSSQSLGKATTSVTLNEETTDEDEKPIQQEEEASNFSVEKTGNVECVERISPNNSIDFTITTTNKSNSSQGIKSVTDKLPLGLKYTEGTTTINGISVNDSEYIDVQTTGETQELIWSKESPWTISAGQTLTIAFSATAEANSLTGANKNEVVIDPVQVPDDPNSLRTSFNFLVAQDCDNPTTTPVPQDEKPETPQMGLFDNTLGKIILGIFIISLGWIIYTKPIGQRITQNILSSGIYNNAEMTTWRIFKPKKYFEEKTVTKLQKRK